MSDSVGRLHAGTVLALAIAGAVHALPLHAQVDPRPLEEAVEAVRNRFCNRASLGEAWDRAVAEARERARDARSRDELHAVLRHLLTRLESSHTALIDGDVYRDRHQAEFEGRPAPQAGLELGRFPEGTFVTAVHDGGPADRLAVTAGDRVVAVNRLAPEESVLVAGMADGVVGLPYTPAVLRAPESGLLELLVQSSADPDARRRVRLRPVPWSGADATRASARIVERDGLRLGVLHPWHFIHWDVVRAMRASLEGPLAEADGLVLDLRGRGGRTPVMWGALALFTPRRDGSRPWNRPAVALIDGSARSAKEIFAWHWRRLDVGPLVGQRTAGAVLGADFIPLSDGAVLMLPVADVRNLTGGESLEGRGVEPDAAAEWTIPYCGGRDAILDKGLETLADEIARARRRRAYGLRLPWPGF